MQLSHSHVCGCMCPAHIEDTSGEEWNDDNGGGRDDDDDYDDDCEEEEEEDDSDDGADGDNDCSSNDDKDDDEQPRTNASNSSNGTGNNASEGHSSGGGSPAGNCHYSHETPQRKSLGHGSNHGNRHGVEQGKDDGCQCACTIHASAIEPPHLLYRPASLRPDLTSSSSKAKRRHPSFEELRAEKLSDEDLHATFFGRNHVCSNKVDGKPCHVGLWGDAHTGLQALRHQRAC